ncbi:hypothetical protein [Saccharopolyspora dendranthemae]|uniref:hypothetical protein n=1 Tax=Saccharopolyspora dendranthemae TaxID=1181886 RepID=UPI00164773C5|nr:hypothetical protein [Saccharopolyspora dendranthemae]
MANLAPAFDRGDGVADGRADRVVYEIDYRDESKLIAVSVGKKLKPLPGIGTE